MRLSEALRRFVLQMRADGRSEHTVAQYARAIGVLDGWLAASGRSDDLGTITHEVLAQFLVSPEVRNRVRGGLKKPASVNAMRACLRTFFRHANEAGYAGTNAAHLIRRARCPASPPRGLSDDQVARLEAKLAQASGTVGQRDRLLLRLLLGTGLRIGSALALDVGDVDLADGSLRIRTLKGGGEDRVFFGAALRDELARAIDGLPAAMALFRAPSGERLGRRQAQRRIEHWFARAGVEGRSAHSLRHTLAARLLARTGDLFLVKRALLHRSVTSTAVYLSMNDARLREAVAAS